MRVYIGLILSLLSLHYLVVVENTGTVSVNFYKFNTYGELNDGSSCDGWGGGECESYFYFKYRQCYSSFSSCAGYTSNYYYSGGNSATMNKKYYYTTSNSFSGRFMVRMEGWDKDWNADDHLGSVWWKITFYWASSTWKTSRYTFSHGTYYEIKYRFTCNSYYYGNLCKTYCKPRNDASGHYTCSSSGSKICYSGWKGSYCNIDINECTSGAHTCVTATSTCSNIGNGGGYTCICKTGYIKSGTTCIDYNECSYNNGGCAQRCTNSYGSYTCSCYTGYSVDSSDSRKCNDINECNRSPDVCSQQCTNTAGSYTCRCISGYRLSSNRYTCNDINECTENTNLCPSPKKCVNQPGTYKCDCLPGYRKLYNPTRCVDINECTTGTDLCEHTCANRVGSYVCGCNTNYYLSGSYSCAIVKFTVSISLHAYGSSYAYFRVNKRFTPTTSSVSVTNQIHALDLSFGNGKYAVNLPTTSSYPKSSGLKPYRLYKFYVTTTGTLYSDDSNYYTLRTATSYPSAPPQNVRVTASTSKSLRIQWARPPGQDCNGIITGYTLLYKKSTVYSYTTISTSTVTLASISGLNEFTDYQIKIAAKTSRGRGPFSDLVVSTTDEAAPVSPPQIAVTNVAVDSITIRLTPPSVDRINGELTEYQVVYYGQSIDQTVKTIDIQPNTNWITSVNYRLTQLEENVVYRIKARIRTRIGSGPYSVFTIQKTLPSAPSGAPSNLVFSSIQTTSLSLSWNPPPIREQNSDTIAYRVQYYGNSVDASVRNVTTANTNIALSGLEEGEVYTVVVCSYSSEGPGPCEATEQQTLENLPTGYPQSVNAIALHDTGIQIFWNPLLGNQANGAILRYEVSVNGTQHDNQTHLYLTNRTIISVINLEEFERYLVQVRAINSIGAGPYSNTVEVRTHQDVPAGAPRDLQGSANKDTVLLKWNVPLAADINGEITSFEVHYAGTLEDTSNRTVMVGDITQYNLQQLVVDETYLIQVRAYTSVGSGPYSNWIVIRTLEDAPTSPPSDVTTIAISSTSIEVLWKAPVKQGQNGVIIGYDVELTAVSSSYKVTQSFGGNIDLFTFTNLKPYREYNVRVAAKTQAGVGPFSVSITEKTMQDIPELSPSSLHIRNVTARTVTIGWTPVSDDAINGILRHYELLISSSASTIKVEAGLTSYTLLGLMPNTQYSVRIAAETSPGTGPYTAPLNFTTREEAPSEGPSIDSVNSITSTTFVVVWSATLESVQNGALTGYEVSVTEESTGVIVYDRISDASETRITVSSLNEYTRYRVSVDAINSAGSSPSTIISVETAQSKPSSPPLYISSIVNTTWIELNWFAPNEEDQNGIITGYVLHINDWTVTTNLTEYTFTNLEEATDYVIQISAMTLIGTGPLSTAINLTTIPIAPTAPPQDVNASAIASEQIRVTWKPIPTLEQNGRILHYIVYYWVRNLNNTLESISTNTSTQVTLSSLEPHTVYEILVFAVNVIGNSPKSKTISVKTWEDIPSVPPGNFSAHVMSPSSVSLTWTPVSQDERNGIIIHQTITYQGSKIDIDLYPINIDTNRTNFTFSDFYPSATYNFSLYQSTIVGNGPKSYATITMPETNPTAAPEYVLITNIETGFHVEWNELPLETRNGEIILYEISLTTVPLQITYNNTNGSAMITYNSTNGSAMITYNSTNGSAIMTYNSTNAETALTNLTVSTLYSIKVRAMTSVGYGPYSDPLKALTAPEGLKCFGYFSFYEREPCQNEAVCKPKNTNEFTCDCVPGYDGVICQNDINECATHNCEHGECIDQINNYTCNCYAGYSGRFCEVELNECSSEPCQNGGTCIDRLNDYECFCTDEYLGPDCEYPNKCLESPCQHGTCHPIQDTYVCSCENGYKGDNCDININDCADVVCKNGGECLDGITKFDCTCYFGYKGRYCQYPGKELTCESETISRIKWPATEYSKTAVMPCQYIDPSFVFGNASRKCSPSGIWESSQMTECIRTQFELLSTHLHSYDDIFGESTQIDINNITDVVRSTAYTVCGRSILSPQEIMLSLNLTEYALNSISNLNNGEEKSNLISSLSERFLCVFSAIASMHNVEFFSGNYQNMTLSLFNTLKLFATMSAQTYIKMPNDTCSSILSDNVQLTVQEIEIKMNNSYFNVISDCNQTITTYEGNSISFPPSLTKALFDSNARLGVSVLYSNTLGQIFTSSSTGSFGEYEPASTLAMVELATDLPNQLIDPIHLNFSILNTEHGNYNAYCVHWDSATLGWSEHGLSVYERNRDSITCSSTHLSTFMVLTETIVEPNRIDRILTYAIYAVCGTSLLCLIVAIFLIISLGRKLAESDIYIAQFSLGFAITLSVISHVVGLLSYAPIRDYCNIVAEVVYFFSLASATCFLAEGAAICFRFVLMKLKKRIHILLIALGWIVPIPLAVFRILSDMNNLGVQGEYCWLSSQNSIIWSMTEPILVIFFIALIGMFVSIIRLCTSRKIEQVRIARSALSGHILLAPFVIAPWVLTIVNMYVPVPYYRWVYASLIAFQGILFFILYAIRNDTIRSQLRFCKTRKPKDGEIDQESILELPIALKSLDKPIAINDNFGFSNPIYSEEIAKDSNEGATHYANEKLPDLPEKTLAFGYNNTVCDNDYEELKFLESKVDNPFSSEISESTDFMHKECMAKRPSLFSDDIMSEIENRYGVSPTLSKKELHLDVVIENQEICGDSDKLSIRIPGNVIIENQEICRDSDKVSIGIPENVVIENQEICGDSDKVSIGIPENVVIENQEICGNSDEVSSVSDKAQSMEDPDSSNV